MVPVTLGEFYIQSSSVICFRMLSRGKVRFIFVFRNAAGWYLRTMERFDWSTKRRGTSEVRSMGSED